MKSFQEMNQFNDPIMAFREGFRKGLESSFEKYFGPDHQTNPFVLFRLNAIKEKMDFLKPPSLPCELIEAVSKYNLPLHQKILKNWMANTHDKNAVDKDGNTLLHIAAQSGKPALISWILKNGIEIDPGSACRGSRQHS